jgi:hypothetical protein
LGVGRWAWALGVLTLSAPIDNPRIGFDVPFGVRIDIAIEPNNILDFIGLYFNNRSPGEKLQGMVQVKCHDAVGTYTGAGKQMALGQGMMQSVLPKILLDSWISSMLTTQRTRGMH